MAKKKNTKKSVSKRNKTTAAPKTRKPRAQKPEVVVTTESAITTVCPEVNAVEIPSDPQVVLEVASIVPPAPIEVEYTKVNKNVFDSAWEWINFKLDDAKVFWKKTDPIAAIRDFAFTHPLIFGIGFAAVVGAVALGAAVAFRYLRW